MQLAASKAAVPPRLAVLTAPQIGRPASSGRPAWLLGCSTPSGGGLWLFRAWLRTLEPPSAYARVAHSSAFGRPGKLIKLLSGAGEEKDDAGEVTVSASLTPTLLTVAGTIALGAAARSKVNVPPRVLVPQLDRWIARGARLQAWAAPRTLEAHLSRSDPRGSSRCGRQQVLKSPISTAFDHSGTVAFSFFDGDLSPVQALSCSSCLLGLGLGALAPSLALTLTRPPIQALYYSIVTVTTVGYGDYTPRGDTALGFTTLYALFGTVLVSVENKPRMAGRPARPERLIGRGWPEVGAARSTIWRRKRPPESQLAGRLSHLAFDARRRPLARRCTRWWHATPSRVRRSCRTSRA